MGHHFVPQFYLRGFTEGNTIWVYDRQASCSFNSQPKTVANENKMYTEEIEGWLANEIEGPAQPAIQKVRERRALSDEDRLALARYIFVLWKRVPEGRARFAAHLPEVAESVKNELHESLSAAAATNPDLAHLAETRKEEVSSIIERYQREKPAAIWQSSLMKESSAKVVDSTLSMNWCFLCSDRLQFLTCDNPVFFFSHEGINQPTSELTVPLSSSVALWATRRPIHGSTYVSALPVAVREINRRTATNATRFVYSMRTEPWILPFVCKGDYVLNRLI